MKKEFIGFIPTYNTEDFLKNRTTTSEEHPYLGEDIIIDNSQLSPILKYKQKSCLASLRESFFVNRNI